MSTLQGTVIWFSAEKGYGFIKRDDTGEDLFVHYTAIQHVGYKELKAEQRVEFFEEQGMKGPQAANVKPI